MKIDLHCLKYCQNLRRHFFQGIVVLLSEQHYVLNAGDSVLRGSSRLFKFNASLAISALLPTLDGFWDYEKTLLENGHRTFSDTVGSICSGWYCSRETLLVLTHLLMAIGLSHLRDLWKIELVKKWKCVNALNKLHLIFLRPMLIELPKISQSTCSTAFNFLVLRRIPGYCKTL